LIGSNRYVGAARFVWLADYQEIYKTKTLCHI
jgi:hypothetical protein